MTQLELFAEPITCAVCGAPAQPRREHAPVCTTCSDIVHHLMPNMSYVCYENVLSVAGHWDPDHTKVTCPNCLAQGWDNIRDRTRRQMGQCVTCGTRMAKDVCPEGCS